MPFALSPVLPAKCRKHCCNILFRSCLLGLNGLGNSILVGITKFDSAHRAAGKPCPVKNDAPATLKRFLPPVHQIPRDPNDRPMSRCVVHYTMSICRNQAFLFGRAPPLYEQRRDIRSELALHLDRIQYLSGKEIVIDDTVIGACYKHHSSLYFLL